MLSSTEITLDQAQPTGSPTDGALEGWHPDRISDRKLTELHDRLERLRSLGDTFANVKLSDEALARLARVESRA